MTPHEIECASEKIMLIWQSEYCIKRGRGWDQERAIRYADKKTYQYRVRIGIENTEQAK